MMKKYLLILPLLCISLSAFAASKSGSDTGYLGNDQWAVRSTGDLVALGDYGMSLSGQFGLGDQATFTAADATPDVSAGSNFIAVGGVTITDFDGTGISTGQVIFVEASGVTTFDVTSSGLKGGTTDLVTADGDLLEWIYNGTDWLLVSFTDMSDDLS